MEEIQNSKDDQSEKEKRDYNLYILAWVTVLGFYGLIALLIFKPLTEAESSPAIFMLFGALSSGFGAIMQYFFGSSKGSNDKNKLMSSKITEK